MGGVQKRQFSEHLLTFHRAGSSDILRDGANLAPSLSFALVRFAQAGGQRGHEALGDGWETGSGGCCRAITAPGKCVL